MSKKRNFLFLEIFEKIRKNTRKLDSILVSLAVLLFYF